MTQDIHAGAGAQLAAAHQPKTLRELAENVKDWVTNQAWPHPDPDCGDIALFGHINEDGVDYPVAEVNADTYGHEGLSLQLAQFYAAAHPTAMLSMMDRIAELEALKAGPPAPAAVAVPEGYDSGIQTSNRVTLCFETQDAATVWFEAFCDAYGAENSTPSIALQLSPAAAAQAVAVPGKALPYEQRATC